MCVCEVGTSRACVCVMWRGDAQGMRVRHMARVQPAPLAQARTYPSSFLLEKEKENLVSLFPDRGDFSSFCSSSIFSRESGLLFCKANPGPSLSPMQVTNGQRQQDRPASSL